MKAKEKEEEGQIKVRKNKEPKKASEETTEDIKDILKLERKAQELNSLKRNEINWTDDSFYDNWDKCKGHAKNLMNHKKAYVEDSDSKFIFIAHSKDKIEGKPQLIEQTMKTIPLIKQSINKVKNSDEEIQSFFFLDERHDKRYDGYLKDTFALDFFVYRVIFNQRDYFILSEQELPNEVCELRGMAIRFDDVTEITRKLAVKTLSNIFILRDYKPKVQILDINTMVSFCKDEQITQEDIINYCAYHPTYKSFNRFPEDVEALKMAHLLSSKVDGYPLHLMVMGIQGTKKSKGYLECVHSKFGEAKICEGATSNLKGLIPSYADRPANVGYISSSNRIFCIDEIGKLVTKEMNKHTAMTGNILGELNSLLDHSERSNTSGNTRSVDACATAKGIIVSNPLSNRPYLSSHIGIIDPTTLSRMFIWVQDLEEIKFVFSEKGIIRSSPYSCTSIRPIKETKKGYSLEKEMGEVYSSIYNNRVYNIIDNNQFLSIYDTCQTFLCPIPREEILRLSQSITNLLPSSLKGIWEPRAEHHVELLIDGLIKFRCLFKDYDASFTAKTEDYDIAERILTRMRKGWDTCLSQREDSL